MVEESENIIVKIAVCFFGHLRTFKTCASHLKSNLLKRYDCDLFMHTWSTYNHNTVTHHENRDIKGFVKEKEIVSVYGEFKKIIIEKQVVEEMGTVNVTWSDKKVSLFGLYSLYHSMKTAFSLCSQYSRQNGVEYDLVVMIRPDIALLDPLDLDGYMSCVPAEELERAYFTFVGGSAKVNIGFRNLGGNDLMFFGKPNVISSIMDGADQELNHVKECLEVSMPEHVLFNIVNNQKLGTYIIDYPGWTIIRPMSFKSKLSRIIRFKGNKNFIKIEFFVFILYKLFSIRFSIGNFEINICAGRPYSN